MSALALAKPSMPVHAGDTVHVPEPVALPCGRVLRRGDHAVLAVDPTPPEHAHRGPYRLTVEARLDCSTLPETHRPGSAYREARGLDAVPACARPTRLFLYPGQFTHYAGGEPRTIRDHASQTS